MTVREGKTPNNTDTYDLEKMAEISRRLADEIIKRKVFETPRVNWFAVPKTSR